VWAKKAFRHEFLRVPPLDVEYSGILGGGCPETDGGEGRFTNKHTGPRQEQSSTVRTGGRVVRIN
jgi:hypothetical protein